MDSTPDLPIVVGIDGSPEASRALAFAVRQAERDRCSLWLVNAIHEVVPIGPMLPLLSVDPLLDVGRQLLAEAQELVEELSDGKVRVRRQVALGPAAELLAAAGERARLVVVGHRSASVVERVFTGSTTFGVVSRAPCPVLSVPSGWDQDDDRHLVVAAIDGSQSSANVLARGFSAASQRSAQLEIVHCWRLDPFYSYLVDEWSIQQEWGAQTHEIIDGLVENAAHARPDVPFHTVLEYANVAEALVRCSAGADLLVMGRHGHGGVGSRMIAAVLGSVTRAVLQHARCPVEVVPPGPPVEPPDGPVATESAEAPTDHGRVPSTTAPEPVGGPPSGGRSS